MTPDPAGRGPTEVFGPLAGEYARFRPGYPAALFDALACRLDGVLGLTLDLGSGTGMAVAPLLARGARVLAVEPNQAMLAMGGGWPAGRSGWTRPVVARAESLPVTSGVATCVTVAQAFHWFEAAAALDEIARVLRAGGVLALLWNITLTDAFTDAVGELVRRYNTRYGRPVTRSMLATPEALAGHPSFIVDPPEEFHHHREMTEDAFVGYAFSWSYCGGALGPVERDAFEEELRRTIRRHHPGGLWHERFTAVAHFARRIPRGDPSVAGGMARPIL